MKRALFLLLLVMLAALPGCSTKQSGTVPPGYEMDTTPGDNGEAYR